MNSNRPKLSVTVSNLHDRVLLKHYIEGLQRPKDDKQGRGSKAVMSLCLEGFSNTLSIICTRHRTRLGHFLLAIGNYHTRSDLGISLRYQ